MDPNDYDYTRDDFKFIRDLVGRFKHRTMKGQRMMIDIAMYSQVHGGRKRFYYTRVDRWTDKPGTQLHSEGYLPVTNMPGLNSLAWWGVPVYIQIRGGKRFDIAQKDAEGYLIYSQDTAATLHDELNSRATLDFLKGMAKTSLPAMDVQKMIMIAIIGVGAFLGLMMMGII